MAIKVILKDGQEPNTYVLETMLASTEPHQGEYPCHIRANPVEDCWVIHLSQPQADFCINREIGIAKSKSELVEKVHSCALTAGREYAEQLGCQFVDETRQTEINASIDMEIEDALIDRL